jgi:lipoprotein NlpD
MSARRVAGIARLPLLGATLLLAACAGKSPAPVEDQSPSRWMSWPKNGQPAPAAAMQSAPVPQPETAVPPGYYRVVKGDTLYSIALDNGQDYREMAEWNRLADPAQIKVGQVLRVIPPGAEPAPDGAIAVARPVGAPPQLEAAALDAPVATGPKPAVAAPAARPAPAAAALPPNAATAAASPAAPADRSRWAWPGAGSVIAGFDGAGNKGIDLAGKAGDPVQAAGDGKVVYVGSGLRGYGQLVIVKHDAEYLTAYAHNRKILVREGQQVKRGETIAEMGDSDADRVKLHFELRRQGKPVDPLKHLPAR